MEDQTANKIETSRLHIQRAGTIMVKICKFVRFGIFLLILSQIVLLLVSYFNHTLADYMIGAFRNNTLFVLLSRLSEVDKLPIVYQALIACASSIITDLVLFLFVGIFGSMMEYLSEGSQPFTVDNARKLRHRSFLSLLMCLYSIPLGLISFGMTILFSYLMEYGGYIQQRADETNRIQEEMIYSFAEITENKSGQTGKHILRVSEYAKILAEQLGFSSEDAEKIRIASTMHDIGKLMIPSEILEKPGKLTKEEYDVIKTHTTYGGQLLKNVEGEEMKLSRTIALEHHERYDGNGYPEGLAGEDISKEGRIVAVADVYDALTSKRSYKEKWEEQKAYDEIVKGRGTQFDPEVVDAFVSAHDKILEVQKEFADQ